MIPAHVWRIEGRANGFVPWVCVDTCKTIEEAAALLGPIKTKYQFYAVRVRVNF